jgi:hypothetical protein
MFTSFSLSLAKETRNRHLIHIVARDDINCSAWESHKCAIQITGRVWSLDGWTSWQPSMFELETEKQQ